MITTLLSSLRPTWLFIALTLAIIAQSVIIFGKDSTIKDLNVKIDSLNKELATCQAYQNVQNEKIIEWQRVGQVQAERQKQLDQEAAVMRSSGLKNIEGAKVRVYSDDCNKAVKEGIQALMEG